MWIDIERPDTKDLQLGKILNSIVDYIGHRQGHPFKKIASECAKMYLLLFKKSLWNAVVNLKCCRRSTS